MKPFCYNMFEGGKNINQQSIYVQKMIDWIEEHIQENPTLLALSNHIGYSPYYCSSLFHKISGITFKNYLAGRRLCYAAIALRDTTDKIIDIALQHGFSSQEALTRAFVKTYGCTPYAYRINPTPIKLSIKYDVLKPNQKIFGGINMTTVKEANIRFEFIPAHKYIGIWDLRAKNYDDFGNITIAMTSVEPLTVCARYRLKLWGVIRRDGSTKTVKKDTFMVLAYL